MTFINGITLLLIYELVGEIITLSLRLSIPGPVVGMTLLFLTLLWRRKVPRSLDSASSALLSHLSLLFVPAGVGLITHFDLILQEWVAISLTLALSTIITITTTAGIMVLLTNLLSPSNSRLSKRQ